MCGVGQGMGVQESDANGGLRLEYELSQWYKKEKAARTRPIDEMPDYFIKNMGSRHSRELKAKAAESGTLLFFSIDVIEKHKARMSNSTPLLEAGKSLREYMDITRSHGLRLPTAAHDRLIASYLCFLHAREPAVIHGNPKSTWLSTLCCLLDGLAIHHLNSHQLYTILMSTTVHFCSHVHQRRLLAFFPWRRQHHHRSVLDSMAAAMISAMFYMNTFASQRAWTTRSLLSKVSDKLLLQTVGAKECIS